MYPTDSRAISLKDDWRDVAEGIGGAAIMIAAFVTPFLREARSHWGLDAADAARSYRGDDLVADPRWSWTHAVVIEAAPHQIWPWIAQLGADRAGFYSYQWLENLAGCALHNAEAIHPEWSIHEGDDLRLHPEMPPLEVVLLDPGRCLVAHAPPDANARAERRPWANVSWGFYLQPIDMTHTRFVSRYRCDTSDDIAMRISLGPALIEPIGFAMDRRMLLGVKARVEASIRAHGGVATHWSGIT